MCGPSDKKIGEEKIIYKNFVIIIEKRIAYPKRLNKIFYNIKAITKEKEQYYKDMNFWYKNNYGNEKIKPKNPDYKDGKYIRLLEFYDFEMKDMKNRRIKTQEQIDEIVMLMKKKIDSVTK